MGRHVDVPARGKGKCWKKKHARRYLKKKCNTDRCYGDEECVAKVDVLIALDGSGSVKNKGFKVLKDFAANLAKQYRGQYEDHGVNDETFQPETKIKMAAQVGVIQFGNGVIDDEGVVGPADIIQGLTNTTADAVKALEELEWRRGFTNMAQAFTAAESAFLKKESIELMKSWSSVPRATNFIHIPGLKNLRKNMPKWVNRVLIRSCSKTVSVRKEKEAEER